VQIETHGRDRLGGRGRKQHGGASGHAEQQTRSPLHVEAP
jgi:hypothetical protein